MIRSEGGRQIGLSAQLPVGPPADPGASVARPPIGLPGFIPPFGPRVARTGRSLRPVIPCPNWEEGRRHFLLHHFPSPRALWIERRSRSWRERRKNARKSEVVQNPREQETGILQVSALKSETREAENPSKTIAKMSESREPVRPRAPLRTP
jgi:hypothetical protein